MLAKQKSSNKVLCADSTKAQIWGGIVCHIDVWSFMGGNSGKTVLFLGKTLRQVHGTLITAFLHRHQCVTVQCRALWRGHCMVVGNQVRLPQRSCLLFFWDFITLYSSSCLSDTTFCFTHCCTWLSNFIFLKKHFSTGIFFWQVMTHVVVSVPWVNFNNVITVGQI